ncbi:MAG TPA: cyclase family protein [Actinomycetota bacterium]|nr:cyclase family protein [Actinomycetota bacterium]
MTTFVDLSHPIADGAAAYPGLPAARFFPLLEREASRERYDGKAEFLLGGFEIAGNTGTYLDSPFHRYADGMDLAAIPLTSCVGLPGVIVETDADDRRLSVGDLVDGELAGRAVLFRTGWNARWGTEAYWRGSPFLGAELVERLVDAGAALVGIDAGNVDDTGDSARPAHTGLLAAGIPIVENLTNLAALPAEGFVFSAAPPPFVGGAAFPVRAFAEVP